MAHRIAYGHDIESSSGLAKRMKGHGLDRARTVSILLLLILLVASLWRPPYPEQIALHHIPTAVALAVLVVTHRKKRVGLASFLCVVSFLAFHVVGARFSYSFVPYEQWLERWAGFSVVDTLGWTRNHYDRAAHFLYGLLLLFPAVELTSPLVRPSALRRVVVAALVLMAGSMLYEVAEWLVAVTFAPETADLYNGQQGDMWDAQKDMALAALGTFLSGAAVLTFSSSATR